MTEVAKSVRKPLKRKLARKRDAGMVGYPDRMMRPERGVTKSKPKPRGS